MNMRTSRTVDPRGEWDSWRVAPRGWLQLLPQFARDARQLRGPAPGTHQIASRPWGSVVALQSKAHGVAPPEAGPCCAGAPKPMIDFDGMSERARASAARAWEAWTGLCAEHPAGPATQRLPRQAPPGAQQTSEDDAKTAHLLQPAVQEFALAAVTQAHPYFTTQILLEDPVAASSAIAGHVRRPSLCPGHGADLCVRHTRRPVVRQVQSGRDLGRACPGDEGVRIDGLAEDTYLVQVAAHC